MIRHRGEDLIGHLGKTKAKEELVPSTSTRDRAYVRGISPIWIKDPFEALVMGVQSAFATDAERIEWSDTYWDVIFERHERPVELSRQARIVLGWRLTRLLAQHGGLLDIDTPLAHLPHVAWLQPSPTRVKSQLLLMPLSYHFPRSTRTGSQTQWPDRVPDDYSHSLRPPRENTPERDVWLAFVRYHVDRYAMHQGVEEDPLLGRAGVRMLLSDEYVGRYWPAPEELIDFEEELVFEVTKLLSGNLKSAKAEVVSSRLGVLDHIRTQFNLTLPEARAVVSMARKLSVQLTRGSREEAKASMELLLEETIHRARMSDSLRDELTGLKSLAQVQGLTQNDEQGGLEQVIDALDVVSREAEEEDEAMFQRYLVDSESPQDEEGEAA